jgi:hypothetical protein
MYFDMYLKFDTEADAKAALFTEEVSVQGDVVETYQKPKYAAIDVIGTIYKPTGKMLTTDDGEVPEMAPMDGWHINVRHTEEVPELDSYKIEVKTPARMWA